jgi:hypothetical protein
MSVQSLDPRHDANSDEMRFLYPFSGQSDSEIRVPRSAMAQGEAWVKARIKGWLRYHKRPGPGTSIRIEDEQFDPKLRQPEG